jgi:hypothetical protein
MDTFSVCQVGSKTFLSKTQIDHIAMNLTLVKEIVKMPTLITLTDKGLYIENNPRNSVS